MASRKKLEPGAQVSISDRWWALAAPGGRALYRADGNPHVYSTRTAATEAQRNSIAACIVVRLDDVTGTVYR